MWTMISSASERASSSSRSRTKLVSVLTDSTGTLESVHCRASVQLPEQSGCKPPRQTERWPLRCLPATSEPSGNPRTHNANAVQGIEMCSGKCAPSTVWKPKSALIAKTKHERLFPRLSFCSSASTSPGNCCTPPSGLTCERSSRGRGHTRAPAFPGRGGGIRALRRLQDSCARFRAEEEDEDRTDNAYSLLCLARIPPSEND